MSLGRTLSLASLLSSSVVLTGCALTSTAVTAPTASAALRGHVFGGQQPVTGSLVTVWQAGATGYGQGASSLATTSTDQFGNFSFDSGAYKMPRRRHPYLHHCRRRQPRPPAVGLQRHFAENLARG